jgi:dihydroorotase
LNAEPRFLPHLHKLHKAFPNLRIVLEHATTRAAVEAVKACGDTVACTITAHHLALTVDDWAGQSWNFCKPVAKFPDDRQALRDIIKEGKRAFVPAGVFFLIDTVPRWLIVSTQNSGHPRFFLGSDSAPHLPHTKSTSTPSQGCAAGIYTSSILLPLTAHLLESFDALDRLADFASNNGRAFYKRPAKEGRIATLKRLEEPDSIPSVYSLADNNSTVTPFWAGKKLDWSL